MKALAFNPLDDSMEPRVIETDFKVVDEFYIKTSVGPLMAGEVWKDTPTNRMIIDQMKEHKQVRKNICNEVGRNLHKLLNQKEK